MVCAYAHLQKAFATNFHKKQGHAGRVRVGSHEANTQLRGDFPHGSETEKFGPFVTNVNTFVKRMIFNIVLGEIG